MLEQLKLDLNREFPIRNELAFFNHAGVAPISDRAAERLRTYASQASERAYLDAGWYRSARETKRQAASLINAPSDRDMAFMPNTSAGLAQVANGLPWNHGDQVVITNVEYPANRYPWENLKRQGVELVEVKQRDDGRIHVDDVLAALTDRTRVVSLSHVQYASGHRIDLKPIADAIHKRGGMLCVDAIQSVGVLPVDVQAMGIDFLSADGHKWMLGPEGCGMFYCRAELIQKLHPNVVGWMNMIDAQNYGNYRFEFERDARRFEPGSYNIPGVLALGGSLELINEVGIESIWQRVLALTARLCEGLHEKSYRIFSPREVESECSGIVIFEPPSKAVDVNAIVKQLEEAGVIIVVREGRLRASPHFYNDEAQVDRLLEALPG